MYSYPIWLLIFVILPLSILWILNYQRLKKYKKVFYLTIIGALIFSYLWDLIAINQRIWYFELPHILGIFILGLPLEEYVFIIGIVLLFTITTILLWERLGKP